MEKKVRKLRKQVRKGERNVLISRQGRSGLFYWLGKILGYISAFLLIKWEGSSILLSFPKRDSN